MGGGGTSRDVGIGGSLFGLEVFSHCCNGDSASCRRWSFSNHRHALLWVLSVRLLKGNHAGDGSVSSLVSVLLVVGLATVGPPFPLPTCPG